MNQRVINGLKMKKPAYFKQNYLFLCVVLFLIPVLVFPQSQPIEDFLLNAYVGVRADHGPDEMVADMAPVEVQYPGYYRMYPNMVHDSGDEQLNESYYLTVHHEDGTVSTPVDANAGPYKVVPDIPGFTKPIFEDAGLFYFKQGISIIKLHHYAKIYEDYPQFLNPPMGGTTQHSQAESVYIQDSLRVIAEPLIDGLLDSRVLTPREKLYDGSPRKVAYPGEEVTITLVVENIYLNDIRFAKMVGTLPDSLIPLSFSVAPKDTNLNTYLWEVPRLAPDDSFKVSIVGKLPPKMPKGYTLLELPAKLTAPNDIDTTNNVTNPSFWSLADSSGDPPEEMADLNVALYSHIDSTITINGDTLKFAYPNDTFNYSLTVTNLSPDTAKNVVVSGKLSELLNLQYTPVVAQYQQGDSLAWTYDQLLPYELKVIPFVVKIKNNVAPSDTMIISYGFVAAANDTLPLNNTDSDTVYVIKPPPEADLSLSVLAETEKYAIINDNTEKVVLPGDLYSVQLNITNNGPDPATNVKLWTLKPDSVSFSDFNITPSLTDGDTLFWNFNAITTASPVLISFSAQVSNNISSFPYKLTHYGFVQSPVDKLPENNSDIDSVFVVESEPPPQNTDVSIALSSVTDTTIIKQDTEWNAVKRGYDYNYVIELKNLGVHSAQVIRIVQTLPENVVFRNATFTPAQQISDSLLWELPELDANSDSTWQVTVNLPENVPEAVEWLYSSIHLSAENDTTANNNTNLDTVAVVPKYTPPPVKKTDLAINLSSVTDTSVTVQGREWNAVKPGSDFSYQINLQNKGPNTADSVIVIQKLPAQVTFKSSVFTPYQQKGDSLFWELKDIQAVRDSSWEVTVTLPETVPNTPTWLYSSVELIAVQDSTAGNNVDKDTVAVAHKIPPPPVKKTDLAINLTSVTDSSVTEQGREWNAVKSGEDYLYQIKLQNIGPNNADSVQIIQKLPANVVFKSSAFAPYLQRNDSLFWKINDLPATMDSTWLLTATLSGSIPATREWLYSSVELFSANDSTAGNNTDDDSLKVIQKPPVTDKKFDAALTFIAVDTDTQIVINDNTFPAVFAGNPFQYRLQVKNNGPNHAGLINLNTIAPDILDLSAFSKEPVIKNDSLFWSIDTLNTENEWTVTFTAQTPDSFTVFPYELNANAFISASLDTFPDNDAATARIYVVQKQITEGIVDMVPEQFAVTDSFALNGSDTLKYAAEGETYLHYLFIKNAGNKTAVNVNVVNYFPDSVTVSNINPAPESEDADSSKWVLDTLAPDEKVVFQFEATVPETMPVGTNPLVNRVSVSANNETKNKTSNNSSVYSVYNFVKTPEPFTPDIKVVPTAMDVTESAQVSVMVPIEINNWDLWIYWPDGQIIKTFADDFIENNKMLQPNIWYDIDDMYKHPQLISLAEQDQIIFEIRASDRRGTEGAAQATLIVRSGDHLVLDRNVYQPGQPGVNGDDNVDIRFKLGYRRLARLDVYDVSGRRITKLTEDIYNGGWNSYKWNGMIIENGRPVGSGVYLITLQSGEFKDWKKLIIVR